MRILAIDTSSKVLGVAILDEAGGEFEFNYSFELRHASHLIPTIKNVLGFAQLDLGDIDAYCVSIGPGSFTGLRIGVATVKALAAVDKKKVVAVPSLDVLACNIYDAKKTICVLVDAKKEKLYSAFYAYKSEKLRRVSKDLLIGYDDLLEKIGKYKNGVLLIGDGIEKLRTQNPGPRTQKEKMRFVAKEFWHPRAINVARIGLGMLKEERFVKDVDALVPEYMFPRDVQCKK